MTGRRVSDPARAWASRDTVEYYRSARCSVEHLYDSEKRFLGDLLGDASSVLDFGCAAGGFFNVVQAYSPGAAYTGLDICPEMIDAAKADHPEGEFKVFSGGRLPFPDDNFDAVVSLGVLHMTPGWRRLITELWRVCGGRLLFDLRVAEGRSTEDPEVSYQKMAFGGEWDGVSVAPYLVAELDDAVEVIKVLKPPFGCLQAYGYMHPVSDMNVSPIREVCMSVFLLDKVGPQKTVEWALPLDCPREFRNRSPI